MYTFQSINTYKFDAGSVEIVWKFTWVRNRTVGNTKPSANNVLINNRILWRGIITISANVTGNETMRS